MKHTSTVLAALLLVSFSLSLFASAAAPPAPDDSANQLIESLGCRGCHQVQGYGGTLAPDLTDVGSRLTTDEIASVLSTHPGSGDPPNMPSYATLTTDEIDKLSIYLYKLR